MRLILFFDLPIETSSNQKQYRDFVKNIKAMGFYMMQKSVYLKLTSNSKTAERIISNIKSIVPKDGDIAVLTITEKQFSEIQYLIGESYSKIINNNDRLIVL